MNNKHNQIIQLMKSLYTLISTPSTKIGLNKEERKRAHTLNMKILESIEFQKQIYTLTEERDYYRDMYRWTEGQLNFATRKVKELEDKV